MGLGCAQLMLTLLLVQLPVVQSRRKREKATLTFSDCGSDPDRLIHFHEVKAHPMPIIVPGTLYVTFAGNFTSDLPRRLTVELNIMNTYDNVCASLERFEGRRCPRSLRQRGLQCHCPFLAGHFAVSDLPLNVPRVKGYAGSLLNVRGLQTGAEHPRRGSCGTGLSAAHILDEKASPGLALQDMNPSLSKQTVKIAEVLLRKA
ncbi:hypothetical protein C0Q70_06003 [Pomacea canaliculata]|uniref:Uncharacterized protein n=1 Tax=Pomacea canaliculata TaxID=400727 RepID=A0A2T7PMR9_POMCA|nr:hypothetical protein C0Q70_06003 [Pomacea canaliculata]